MSAARWSEEQLAAHLNRRGKAAVCKGQNGAAVAVRTRKRKVRDYVVEYLQQLQLAGLPTPETEFRFHATRRWRADFAWPDQMLLAEYEGGIHENGRHVRGRGYEGDCEKYNEAALLGYRVIRFTPGLVKSGLALDMTVRALA